MRKILSLAVMAIVALTSCNRTDDNAPKMYKGVEVGTEFTASVNVGTAAIGVTEEPLGAGETGGDGETTTGIEHGSDKLIKDEAIVAVQIKDNTEDKVIGRGFWAVGSVPTDLKVVLKHGHKYQAEATLFNDPNCINWYFNGQPYTQASFDGKFTDNLTQKFVDLNKKQTLNEQCLRYYVMTDEMTAAYGDNVNISIEMKCVSFKATYAFSNYPKEEGYTLSTIISAGEQSFRKDYTTKNLKTDTNSAWFELFGGEGLTTTRICVDLVKNENPIKILDLQPEDNKGLPEKIQAGYEYKINTDFGIEAGLNITVNQTALTDGGTITLE